ncbi:MAG: helix-turn-helix domain-containing protein, partial [Myxococcales bacterium]
QGPRGFAGDRQELLDGARLANALAALDVPPVIPPSPVPEPVLASASAAAIEAPAPATAGRATAVDVAAAQADGVSPTVEPSLAAPESGLAATQPAQPPAEAQPADPPAPAPDVEPEAAPELVGPALSLARAASTEPPARPPASLQLVPPLEDAAPAAAPRPEPRDEKKEAVRALPKPPEIGPNTVINGELLRRAREARGMTLRELADRTKINATHLDNIEADRYDPLPVAVYLRGFLMSVARELKLDPLRVSKGYLEVVAQARGRQGGGSR